MSLNPGHQPENGPGTGREGRFGAALAEFCRLQQVSQADLAKRVGVSRSSVNEWMNERSFPAPATVFAVERALGLDPGELSIHLGYLPPEVKRSPRRSANEMIKGLPGLSDESKQALIRVYEALKQADSKRGGRPRLRGP